MRRIELRIVAVHGDGHAVRAEVHVVAEAIVGVGNEFGWCFFGPGVGVRRAFTQQGFLAIRDREERTAFKPHRVVVVGQVERYWWPNRKGAMLVPLGKYDSVTGHRAAAWERKHHPPGPSVPAWHGCCHGWAASAVRNVEPKVHRHRQSLDGARVEVRVGDQKGLLASSHTSDVANTYGDRFGDGTGSEDKQDLAPELLWNLLHLYLKRHGVPLILDIEAGPEVWNYPVYAYQVEYRPQGADGKHLVQLALLMADNAVPPDYVGLKVLSTFSATSRLSPVSLARNTFPNEPLPLSPSCIIATPKNASERKSGLQLPGDRGPLSRSGGAGLIEDLRALIAKTT